MDTHSLAVNFHTAPIIIFLFVAPLCLKPVGCIVSDRKSIITERGYDII